MQKVEKNKAKKALLMASTVLIVQLLFWNKIQLFVDPFLRSIPKNSIWFFLMSIFLLALMCAPAGFALKAYNDFCEEVKKRSNYDNYVPRAVLITAVATAVMSLFWFSKAEGLEEGFYYTLRTWDYASIILLTIFTLVICGSLLRHASEVGFSLNMIAGIIFLHKLYLYMGMDDGCVTVDADPLRGGGGYQDCEPGYEKFITHLEKEINTTNFNSAAFFAFDFLITVFLALAIALFWYFFWIKPKERKVLNPCSE